MKFFVVKVIIVLFNLLNGMETVDITNWNYNNIDEWPGFCNTGIKQSPIDVQTQSLILKYKSSLHLLDYEKSYQPKIQNTGYSVELQLSGSERPEVVLGNGYFSDHYVFDNVHFHWNAEHTIDGYRYPLEGHFVHYLKTARNLSNALNHRNGVVVIGVFYKLTTRDNKAFTQLVKNVPQIANNINSPVNLKYSFVPINILPSSLEKYYSYEGSLTTPDCNEAVQWIIFSEPANISKSQVQMSSHWNYDDIDSWPKLCKVGTNQSPIDIKLDNLTLNLQQFQFKNYDVPQNAVIENNGYAIYVRFNDTTQLPCSVSGGILPSEYNLDNIHFHWGSEHTINGHRYPMEAHFVHYTNVTGCIKETLKYPKGIVVVSVFYQLTDEDVPTLNPITENIPIIATNLHHQCKLKNKFIPGELIPKDKKKFYLYEGSLTTPDCNECVQWIIFAEHMEIGVNQLRQFKKIVNHEGKCICINHRPVQDLNGREVYVTFS